MRAPKQERSRESTNRILDAVLTLLSEEGVGGVTTARVAEAAGVSNGSLYHRFGTRDELLQSALERFLLNLDVEVGQLRSIAPETRDLAEAIALTVEAYRVIFSIHGRLISRFFLDVALDRASGRVREPDLTAFATRVFEFFAPFADEITADDPTEALALVSGLLFSTFVTRVLFDGVTDDPSMLRALRHAAQGILQPTYLPRRGRQRTPATSGAAGRS